MSRLAPTGVHGVAHGAEHAERHVDQHGDDYRDNQSEGVLAGFLHGVVGGGTDHGHAQRVADHTEELGQVQRGVPEEMIMIDVQTVAADTVAASEGKGRERHDDDERNGDDENVAEHGRLGERPTVKRKEIRYFRSLRSARGMARAQ